MLRIQTSFILILLISISSLRAQVNAFDDDYLIFENEVGIGNVADNDVLPAGQNAVYTLIDGPSFGSFNFTSGGNFQYTPPLNQFGFPDSIYYQVCVNGVCDVAGVLLYVIFKNNYPFAGDDYFSVEQNTPRSGNVSNNDGDPDSITDPISTELQWYKFTNPTNGTVNSFSIDGTFTYTPNTGFIGNDSFQYYVLDHCGLYELAYVYLNVVGPNGNPVAADQTLTSLNEDVTFNGSLTSLVSDPENDLITYQLVAAPLFGSLQLLTNGSYTYTPPANFTGSVNFTYSACDIVGQCNQGIITLVVNNTDNDPPLLLNDNLIINEDTSGQINVYNNDSDDSATLNYSLVNQAAFGVASLINNAGSFSYTPNTNYFGNDSFTIQACDGVNCTTSVVNITINAINDAPVASTFQLNLLEDISTAGSISTISDVDNTTLLFSTPNGNSITGLVINSNGTYQYTAPANYFGNQTITIQACDANNLCASANFIINVSAVNDMPIVINDTYTINEDQTLSGNLNTGESDVEGSALTYTINQTVVGGNLLLNPSGVFTFTPFSNWFGNQTISVNVCDNQGGCSTSQLVIQVAAVNDAPTTSPANLTSHEDQTLSGNLLSFCSDIEASPLTFTVQNLPASGVLSVNSNGNFSYQPAANFFGNVSFTYQVCDASNSCVSGIVSISIANVNDAPNAPNFSITTNEDVTASGASTGITDIDNNTLSVTLLTPAQNGMFSITNSGSYTYVPNANFFGTETLTYQVCDPMGLCSVGQILIQVSSIQDIPQANGESLAILQGNILNGNLNANDSDGDGDELFYMALNTAQHGTFILSPNGTFSYNANADFLGTESISYSVCDNFGNCSIAALIIDVLTNNTPPIASSFSAVTNEDQNLIATLINSVTDTQGGQLFFSTLQPPTNGLVNWLTNGNFQYVPNTNFFGSDSFEYQVCDNGGLCDVSAVTITVSAINDVPVIAEETLSVLEDSQSIINISSNDIDAEGNLITYELITNGLHGIASISSTGIVIYTPEPNFWGSDEIVYEACDALNACTEATLFINVASVNDAPLASNNFFLMEEDGLLTGSIASLVNHADEEPLFFGALNSPEHGTLSIDNNGEFTYSPTANYFGTDEFSYITCDDFGVCDSAVIIITLSSLNDAPAVIDDLIETNEDIPTQLNISINDSDIENDILNYNLSQTSDLGSIQLSTTGTLTFIPFLNVFGNEEITIEVCDAQGACSTSSLEIVINSVNDSPGLVAQAFTLNEDDSISGSLSENASDAEENNLTFTLLSGGQHGTLLFNTDGYFQYQPNINFFGTDSIAVEVCDSENSCTSATFVFQVLPLNDAPISQNAQFTLPEDTAVQGSLLSLITDADDNSFNFAIIENANHGTFLINSNGGFTYAPSAHYFGADSVMFSACDGEAICDSSWIFLTVSLINDAPIVFDEVQQVLMNEPIVGSIALNDLDFDNDVLDYTIVSNSTGGVFALNSDGSYIFTPTTDTTGVFMVIYSACDPSGSCDNGSITFYVSSEQEANTPPTALNFAIQSCAGGIVSIPLVELITDAQEEPTALNVVVGTANSGSYQFDSETLTLTYQASQFATGTISFNYYICDNGVVSMCDTATISIQILPSSPIQITGFQLSQIDCYGDENGSLSITAQSSQGVVSYAWSNGSSQQAINNLAPGNYSVVISSTAPCPTNQTAQFTITQPSELIGGYYIQEANGINSGDSIVVVASGGVPGYSIVWITPNGVIQNQWSVAINAGGNYSYTITDENDCEYTDNVLITSVDDRLATADLMIYPIPISQENQIDIQCNSKMITLELFDSNGSLLSITQVGSDKASVDASQYSSGVYTVRIATEHGILTRRIVKL
jgi:VCBS repeat-containing protein